MYKTTFIDTRTPNFTPADAKIEEPPRVAETAPESHDFDATVMLTPGQVTAMLGGAEPSEKKETLPEPPEEDFDMNETVIISQEELARQLGKLKK